MKHNVWIVRGAKVILTTMIGGAIPFLLSAHGEIKANRTKIAVHRSKLEELNKKSIQQSKQVDDLHWYLIRSKDVKIEK